MGGSAHLNMTLGALTVIGGAVGYLKAGSLPSLFGGAAIGGLLLESGVLIQRGHDRDGHRLALATSTALVAVMGARFGRTKKFMPAGMAALMGVAGAAYNGKKVYEWSEAEE